MSASRLRWVSTLWLLSLSALAAAASAQAQTPAKPAAPPAATASPPAPAANTKAAVVPLMNPALKSTPAAAAAVAGPRTINWDALVPEGWDPYKDMKATNLQGLTDGDPRAVELMAQLRKSWDNAPVNTALIGQIVRIPGFVVPLEEGKGGVTEFLLVPYFGACVHSPPPPSNQIIHVLPRSPAKDLRSMDTVWITGTLSTVQTDTYMGASSWRLEATTVAPYAEPARR